MIRLLRRYLSNNRSIKSQATGHRGHHASTPEKADLSHASRSNVRTCMPLHVHRDALQPTWSPSYLRSLGINSVSPSRRYHSTQTDIEDEDKDEDKEEEADEEEDDVDVMSTETDIEDEDDEIDEEGSDVDSMQFTSSQWYTKPSAGPDKGKIPSSTADDIKHSTVEDVCGDYVETCWDGGRLSDSDSNFVPGIPFDIAAHGISEETGDQDRPLWKRLEAASEESVSVKDVLNSWAAEGQPLSRTVIIDTIKTLRKRRKVLQALKLSDWVMAKEPYELSDMDYGIRILLIFHTAGIQKAAAYFRRIPKQFQSGVVYSMMLTCYVQIYAEKSAVELVQKAERLGLGHLTYMHNQLLTLYKKKGLMQKVPEILQSMKEKNIQRDVLTYNLLLDIRGRKRDATGLEEVWRELRNDKNVKPDAICYAVLAKGYMLAGFPDKALKVLKRLETIPADKKRLVHHVVLKCYASLGKEEEVERIWSSIGQGRVVKRNYIAMIECLGKTGNVARAEQLHKEMITRMGADSIEQYHAILSVYANSGMVKEGENVMRELLTSSCKPTPWTYHEYVKLYVNAGNEEKAMQALWKAQKAGQGSTKNRPIYASYRVVIDLLAEKGNVKDAEMVVKLIKDAGYHCFYGTYCTLLKAYANAGIAPYGFIDRMNGSNVFPNLYIRKEVEKLNGT